MDDTSCHGHTTGYNRQVHHQIAFKGVEPLLQTLTSSTFGRWLVAACCRSNPNHSVKEGFQILSEALVAAHGTHARTKNTKGKTCMNSYKKLFMPYIRSRYHALYIYIYLFIFICMYIYICYMRVISGGGLVEDETGANKPMKAARSFPISNGELQSGTREPSSPSRQA